MPSGEHHERAARNATSGADTAQGGSKAVTEPARPLRAVAERDSDPGQHVQAALEAGTRTGASISALFRAVQQMADGVSGARDANEQLVHELQAMHQMLAERTEENSSLEDRLAALAAERDQMLHELEDVRAAAEREREFLVEEQDRFLAALLEDHERALDEMKQERDQAAAASAGRTRDQPTSPGLPAAHDRTTAAEVTGELLEARRTIEKLTRERERSRDVLRRLRAQRDEAQAELANALDQRDEAPLNVTVRTAASTPEASVGAAATTEPPHRPTGAETPKKQERTTDPQGPRARGPDAAKANRKTDPLPRSALARALEASRPADPEPEALTPPGPMGAVADPPAGSAPPPPELQAAIAPPAAKPPLRRKPDPTSRPIGGYSLGSDDVEAERIEGSRLSSSKPPRS